MEGGGKEIREEFMKTGYIGRYFNHCPAVQDWNFSLSENSGSYLWI
jgi:hypothetical protein